MDDETILDLKDKEFNKYRILRKIKKDLTEDVDLPILLKLIHY